jgi:glycerol uptake facilitator-like aquaporin
VPIPNTYVGWGQHFILSIVFDMTKGVGNPSVLYGLWVSKKIKSSEVIVRLFANFIVLFFGFNLVCALYPSRVLTGPTLHTSIYTGIVVEFCLGFLLMLIIEISSKSRTFPPAALTALGIRGLLILEGGRYTG